MTATEWYDKRDLMAQAFGVEQELVPPGAVWFLEFPPRPLTEEDIEKAQELAAELGLLKED